MEPRQLKQGSTIGRYEIRGRLGSGGFAITYHGWDETLKRRVVIKEYFPDNYAIRCENSSDISVRSEETEPTFTWGLERFLDEGRTLAKFTHPSIARVIEFIETNQTAYLIMEFAEGISLTQFLDENKQIDNNTLQSIFYGLLDALSTIHASSYLHRDIKPDNIIITEDDKPILIDFGSSRLALEHNKSSLTRVLTPGFGPVEQIYHPEKQGPWTDLYALGGTMYYCVTKGLNPVAAEQRVINQSSNQDDLLKDICETESDQYDVFFLRVIKWMLSIEPENRPQSVTDVLDYLQKTGEDEPVPTVILSDISDFTEQVPVQKQGKSSWLLPLGIIGVLVLLSVTYWKYQSNQTPPVPIADAEIASNSALSEAIDGDNSSSGIDVLDSITANNTDDSGIEVINEVPIDDTQTPSTEAASEDADTDANTDNLDIELTNESSNDKPQVPEIEMASTTSRQNADSTDIELMSEDFNDAPHQPDVNALSENSEGDTTYLDAEIVDIQSASDAMSEPVIQTNSINKVEHTVDNSTENTIIEKQESPAKDSNAPSPDQTDIARRSEAPDAPAPIESVAVQAEKEREDHPAYSIFEDELIGHDLTGPVMVVVPSGRFLMGNHLSERNTDELPTHTVLFSKTFAVSRYEIAFEEYDYYVKSSASSPPDSTGLEHGIHPVSNVSWHDANAYANWLSEQTGHRYRLPTEAEWEYVARSETQSRYWWGEKPSQHMANYQGTGGRDKWAQSSPAGEFPANFFTLNDVLGNVSEWVMDCYADSYVNAPVDGSTNHTSNCDYHVARGGSWDAKAQNVSVSSRSKYPANTKHIDLGFRLVREL